MDHSLELEVGISLLFLATLRKLTIGGPVTFKAHDSSVVAISFHPNKHYLASASTDKKIMISSCYIKEKEGAENPEVK